MSRQRFTQGSVAAALAVAAGLLAVVSGCAPAVEPAVVSTAAAPTAEPSPLNTSSREVLAQLAAPVHPPLTVAMPDLGIDMQIEPHGLDEAGEMSLPETPFVAAWYQYGSAPGSTQGATVLAAHVDDRELGVGPFSRLREARQDMPITVVDQAGVVHTYAVVSVERIPKAEVPLDQVFTAVGDPHLVLITCGGEFDESVRNYDDNYIVTARKVS